jgi:hypothetical protein
MIRTTILFLFTAICATCLQTVAESLPVRRTVEGATIKSKSDPKVSISFDKAIHYIGGDRFPLYGVADAELHLFVDADANRYVKRLYWVQFEGYLPSNDHTYDYSSDPTIEAAGWTWHTNSKVRPKDTKWRADSDGGHMLALLESKGYKLNGDYARLRLVHLTDETKRSELMIIYMEPASGASDTDQLLKRAFEAMKIVH